MERIKTKRMEFASKLSAQALEGRPTTKEMMNTKEDEMKKMLQKPVFLLC